MSNHLQNELISIILLHQNKMNKLREHIKKASRKTMLKKNILAYISVEFGDLFDLKLNRFVTKPKEGSEQTK